MQIGSRLLYQLCSHSTTFVARYLYSLKVCWNMWIGNEENTYREAMIRGRKLSWWPEKTCVYLRSLRTRGLNIKNCTAWNMASVGKLIWSLNKKSNVLWVKWIHGVYVKDSNFCAHSSPADRNWYWRKLHNWKGWSVTGIQTGNILLTYSGEYSVSLSYLLWLEGDVYGTCHNLYGMPWIPNHRFI